MPKPKPESVRRAEQLLGAHNVRHSRKTGAPIPPSKKQLDETRKGWDIVMAASPQQRSNEVTDQLNEMLDMPEAEAVILKEGERLLGTVVDNEIRHGQYDDEKGHVVTLIQREDGGVVAFHWLGAVLRSRFTQKAPRPGDRVGILRLPDIAAKVKGQSDMKNYKVAVQRAAMVEEEIPF